MSLPPLTVKVIDDLAASMQAAAERMEEMKLKLEFWGRVRALIGDGYGFECERCPVCKVGPVLLAAPGDKACMRCRNCTWQVTEDEP